MSKINESASGERDKCREVIEALRALRLASEARASGPISNGAFSESESESFRALSGELMRHCEALRAYQCDECLEYIVSGGESDRGEYASELLGNDPYCLECARFIVAKHGESGERESALEAMKAAAALRFALSSAASLEATAASAAKRARIASAAAFSAHNDMLECDRISDRLELSAMSAYLRAAAFSSLLLSSHLSMIEASAKQLEAMSERSLEAAAVAFSSMSEADREQVLRSTLSASEALRSAASAITAAISGDSATAKSKQIERSALALLAAAKRALYTAVMCDRYFYSGGEQVSGESEQKRIYALNASILEASAALSESLASEAKRESLDIPIERTFKYELLEAIGAAASELLSGRYECDECGGTGEY